MTEATITVRLDTNNPTEEVVVLTATDTNTYRSRKFSIVTGVLATLMEDTESLSLPLSCGISSSTVTINCTGLSAQKVCLTLYGRL